MGTALLLTPNPQGRHFYNEMCLWHQVGVHCQLNTFCTSTSSSAKITACLSLRGSYIVPVNTIVLSTEHLIHVSYCLLRKLHETDFLILLTRACHRVFLTQRNNTLCGFPSE